MLKEPHKLQKTQKILWQFITAPEGVEKALQDNSDVILPIRGDARLSAAARLAIYANMYFFRILDSLKEDFPTVLKTVGVDRFHNLVTDYLVKHPSKYWTLRNVGKALPTFLKRHHLLRTWPFLSELAQFEWTLLDVFDAANVVLLSREKLSNLKAAQWENLKLQVVPAFRILKSAWPVDQMRQTKRKKTFIQRTKKDHLIVWRWDLKVYYRLAHSLEARLLKKMCNGVLFSEICTLAAQTSGMDQAITSIHKLLEQWLKEGLLVAV